MAHLLTLSLLVVLCLAAPTLAWWYLQRLPFAPDCPTCRAVTRQAGDGVLADRWVMAAVAIAHRECTRCGWRGRMRWRWAPTRISSRQS
jgi:Zn ribbon nucleic-acid-binding protein